MYDAARNKVQVLDKLILTNVQWETDEIYLEIVKEIQASFSDYWSNRLLLVDEDDCCADTQECHPPTSTIHVPVVMLPDSCVSPCPGSGDQADSDSSEGASTIGIQRVVQSNQSPKKHSPPKKRKLLSTKSPSFIEMSAVDQVSSDDDESANHNRILTLIRPSTRAALQDKETKRKPTPPSSNYPASRSSCSSFATGRCAWSMAETYLIYKGVQEGLSWAHIKAIYFRQSSRTNVHIKDRWRVVQKKPDMLREFQIMHESHHSE